jgi:cytochrome c biogenesis protein CcmG, thiol:disulfide interchange protein DsbE
MSDATTRPNGLIRLTLIPALVFVLLALLFLIGLRSRDPSVVPSPLIGKPVPEFALPPLEGLGLPGLDSDELRSGKVTLVNVWASWCGPCRLEHPVLMELAKRTDLQLVGINYKDEAQNGLRFLRSLGVPYRAVGIDRSGRTSIDWGVYGVPESFVVDRLGIIRFKWVGPISDETARAKLEEAIRAAGR